MSGNQNYYQNYYQFSTTAGWQDPLYFSRTFKRAYGLAPRHFCEQNGGSRFL